jgi:adenylate cyclase
MNEADMGKLVLVGGGDAIPLTREVVIIGRRQWCDICLRLPNVSHLHCELSYKDGYWYVRDLGSTNGTKVNGARVQQKLLHPGDKITVARTHWTIEYNLN